MDPGDCEDLVEEIKSLKNWMGALKSTLLDIDLQFRQILAEIESDWRNRVENARLKAEVDTSKDSIEHFRDENATLLMNSKSVSQCGLSTDELVSRLEVMLSAQSDLYKKDPTSRKQLTAILARSKEINKSAHKAMRESMDISSDMESIENRLTDYEEALAEAIRCRNDLRSKLGITIKHLEE